MLKQRVLTALALLPIAIGGFFFLENAWFAAFIGLVVTLGAWEWARLSGLVSQAARAAYALFLAMLLWICWSLPQLALALLPVAAAWWIFATVLVITYPSTAHYWKASWRRLLMGGAILIPAWQGLVLLKQWPLGNWLILSVMVLVWVADIGAYFSGRAFGKRKLAPHVSPGKSWEGLVGGLLASLVMTLGVGLYRGWDADAMVKAVIGATVVVLISVVGDLTESMFKRKAGLKDSSQLLPGHGGVMDRIDSLTAAVPVFAVLLWWSGWGVM
ncbi:phosphatidate cytidylyltransferase [Pseudomonas duriflava]|uniref:Phosphatidate cytidylyltransferase n=1 Tax=Pseudomonas duriflava TaxID=459528 RepID=A0A562QFJ9_9PSED|nr:phosphatidate cytidylyltransferase [Pseudomonas duriflava]TWI55489.1 phosphatidate cytidylyltransferase [Pseudomonas duriflava]